MPMEFLDPFDFPRPLRPVYRSACTIGGGRYSSVTLWQWYRKMWSQRQLPLKKVEVASRFCLPCHVGSTFPFREVSLVVHKANRQHTNDTGLSIKNADVSPRFETQNTCLARVDTMKIILLPLVVIAAQLEHGQTTIRRHIIPDKSEVHANSIHAMFLNVRSGLTSVYAFSSAFGAAQSRHRVPITSTVRAW